jgi:MFS transporter, DHA1 family, multidrug resistance protein
MPRHLLIVLLLSAFIALLGIGIIVPLMPVFAESLGAQLGLFIIQGSGTAIIWPILSALATEEGRIYGHGSMMGVFNLAMSIGVFIGAISSGLTSDWLGRSWTFPLVGILVLSLCLFGTTLISDKLTANQHIS